MAIVTFDIPNVIAAELVAGYERRYARLGGESNVEFLKRVTRVYEWKPVLDEHRRRTIEEATPQPMPVGNDDLGTQ